MPDINTDIIQLPQNTQGDDYIVGDIHGSLAAFQATIDKLQENDRLFLVGDLFDRGENSLGVFKAIQRVNSQHMTPIIYAVRGNHEDLFTAAYPVILTIQTTKKLTSLPPNDLSAIARLVINGGSWIFANEAQRKKITNICQEKPINGQALLANLKTPDLFIPDLNEINEYLCTLPYITLVGNISTQNKKNDAFVVCHADMPISDNELLSRISKNKSTLSEQEKQYCSWARDKSRSQKTPFKNTGRTPLSVITYCGHNTYFNSPAIRSNTNTVNLDSAAFSTGELATVNHTAATVCFNQGATASKENKLERQDTQAQKEILVAFFQQRKITKRTVCTSQGKTEQLRPSTTLHLEKNEIDTTDLLSITKCTTEQMLLLLSDEKTDHTVLNKLPLPTHSHDFCSFKLTLMKQLSTYIQSREKQSEYHDQASSLLLKRGFFTPKRNKNVSESKLEIAKNLFNSIKEDRNLSKINESLEKTKEAFTETYKWTLYNNGDLLRYINAFQRDVSEAIKNTQAKP